MLDSPLLPPQMASPATCTTSKPGASPPSSTPGIPKHDQPNAVAELLKEPQTA